MRGKGILCSRTEYLSKCADMNGIFSNREGTHFEQTSFTTV